MQIQFRLTTDENDALWAMHVKTQFSKSACLRELIVEGLKKRGYLTADNAKRILEQERKARVSVHAPVI